MTILSVNMGDPTEVLEVLASDVEVKVAIKRVFEGVDKNVPELQNLRPIYEAVDQPDVDDIGAFPITIPNADAVPDKKERVRIRDRFKTWIDCFGIDLSAGLNTEALIGLTGTVIVSVSDDEYGRRNQVKTYVVGR